MTERRSNEKFVRRVPDTMQSGQSIKESELKLRNSEHQFRKLFEHAPIGIDQVSIDGKSIQANLTLQRFLGYSNREMYGQPFTRWTHPDDVEKSYQVVQRLLLSEIESESIKKRYIRKDGRIIWGQTTISAMRDECGDMDFFIIIIDDITEEKKALSTLENREKDLREKSIHLEELNVALKVLLDQREQEKKKIEESFSNSISEQIVPYLARIRKTGLNELQKEYINILESNLMEVIRPYKHRISDQLTRLSPSETRIVSYLRQGYSNKEIASMLNVSPRTIEFHRDNIRKKLGLKKRKINLRTYLNGLP